MILFFYHILPQAVRSHTLTITYGGIFLFVPLSPVEFMVGDASAVSVCSPIPPLFVSE